MPTYDDASTFAATVTFNSDRNTTFTTGDSLTLAATVGFSATDKEDRDISFDLTRVSDAYLITLTEVGSS